MEFEVKIKLNQEAIENVKVISEKRDISFDAAVERIVNNQSSRELRLVRDVETTVKNAFEKDSNEYLKIIENEFRSLQSNLHLDENQKTFLYSKLMTKMEIEFRIPALNDEIFNENNEEIIALYRKIADARKL